MKRGLFILTSFLVYVLTLQGAGITMTLEEAKGRVDTAALAGEISSGDKAKALDALQRLSEVIPVDQAYRMASSIIHMSKTYELYGNKQAQKDLPIRDEKMNGELSSTLRDTPSNKVTHKPSNSGKKDADEPAVQILKTLRAGNKQKYGWDPDQDGCRVVDNFLRLGPIKPVSVIEHVRIKPRFGIAECMGK